MKRIAAIVAVTFAFLLPASAAAVDAQPQSHTSSHVRGIDWDFR